MSIFEINNIPGWGVRENFNFIDKAVIKLRPSCDQAVRHLDVGIKVSLTHGSGKKYEQSCGTTKLLQ